MAAPSAAVLCAQLEAVFTPAIDPALIAAIAHEPGQTLEQATQILSQLLPEEDTEPAQEQQQEQTPSSPSTSTSTSATLSESQLHDLLDEWEASAHHRIPEDDDPVLHLTDEENDALKHKPPFPPPPPPAHRNTHAKRKLNLVPASEQDSDAKSTSSSNGSIQSAPADDTLATLSFLAHAFPRLDHDTLTTALAAYGGDLARTLDELVTIQLLADDPGLLHHHLQQQAAYDRHAPPPKTHGGLDLDQLAQGTRALTLAGKKNRAARKRTAQLRPSSSLNQRSHSAAAATLRLGDVRQGAGASAGAGAGPGRKGRAGEATWKDPKQRLAVALPAHLLADDGPPEAARPASASTPASPHLNGTDFAAAHAPELSSEDRQQAILDALAAADLERRDAATSTTSLPSLDPSSTGIAPALAETSTWLLTSSILSQLVLLLRPVPGSHSSPTSAGSSPGSAVNPPLFTEKEAQAVHTRSSFFLPRTVQRLIEHSVDAYDAFYRRTLPHSPPETESDDDDALRQIRANELDELAATIGTVSGSQPRTKTEALSRALKAVKATGGLDEDGGDADAALDLLELWNAVEVQFGRAGGALDLVRASAGEEHANGGEDWREAVRPLGASTAAGSHGPPPSHSSSHGRHPLPGLDLPTLAQAAHIASTRKQAAQLASARRAVTTTASIVKRDPVLGRTPAQVALAAREGLVREQMTQARQGAAVVLPASAATVQQQQQQALLHDDDDEGGTASLSLAARRQRALERLEYASQMEMEYREKRREALRKASTAFRGSGGAVYGANGSGSSATAANGFPLGRDRADVPGSATYFGAPELEPPSSVAAFADGSAPPSTPALRAGASLYHAPSLAPSSTKALRGHAAWYYADEARRLDAKARSWGLKAAQALVEERKLAHAAVHGGSSSSSSSGRTVTSNGFGSGAARVLGERERNVIDLHLLTTGEALAVVKEETDKWWWSTPRGASASALGPAGSLTASSSSSYAGFGPGPLHIITGIGKHSRGNVAVLRPAVCGWLRRNGWDFEEDAPRGRIVVKGFKGRPATTAS